MAAQREPLTLVGDPNALVCEDGVCRIPEQVTASDPVVVEESVRTPAE